MSISVRSVPALLVAAAGLSLGAGLLVKNPSLDVCAQDRLTNPDALGHHTILTPQTVLATCFVLIFAHLVLLVCHAREHWRDVVLDALAALLFYQSSYNVVWTGKHLLQDPLCSSAPNSVSGHYNLFVFALLSLSFLTVKIRRDARWTHHFLSQKLLQRFASGRMAPASYLIILSFFVLAAFACMNCYRTWAYGYHTLRQILLGTGTAFTNTFLWSSTVGSAYPAPPSASSSIVRTSLLHAAVSSAFKFILAPIQLQEQYLLLLLWLVLLLSAARLLLLIRR